MSVVDALRATAQARVAELRRARGRAIVMSPEDVYLLTGFATAGHYVPAAAVVSETTLTLVCRSFELDNALPDWVDRIATFEREDDFPDAVLRELGDGTQSHWAIQADARSVSWLHVDRLLAGARSAGVTITPTARLIADSRLIKSPAELDLMRRAGAIATRASKRAAAMVHAGVGDRAIATEIYRSMIHDGGEYPSLPPFVAIGDAGAHATWSGRTVPTAGPVFIEVGAAVGRYSAAVATTVWLGPMTSEATAAFTSTSASLSAGLDAMTEGATVGDVYRACVEPLNTSGLPYASAERVGYSIGVSFPPDWGEGELLSLSAAEGDTRLHAGMTFHLTPTILLDGVGEIGSSVTAAVTSGRPEILAGVWRA